LKKFNIVFLYTNIYTALGAALASMATSKAFLLNLDIDFFIFLFFATWSSYSLHWYFTSPMDNDLRSVWSYRNKKWTAAFGILSFVIGLFYLTKIPQQYILGIVPLVFFSLLYSAPKIPYQPFIKLRKYVRAKTIYLALAWTYATSVLPFILAAQLTFPEKAITFIVYRFALIFIVCLLFDYRDNTSDKAAGIKSILYNLGMPILNGIITFFISIGFLCNAHLRNHIDLKIWILFFLPLVLIMFLFKKAYSSKDDFFYYFIIDGLMFVQVISLLF
jgi:hypothetical protein